MLNQVQFREQLMREAGRHHAARLLGLHPDEVTTSGIHPIPETFKGASPNATHFGAYRHERSGHEWKVTMALSPDEEASQHMATAFVPAGKGQVFTQVGKKMLDHLYPDQTHEGPAGWVPNPKDLWD